MEFFQNLLCLFHRDPYDLFRCVAKPFQDGIFGLIQSELRFIQKAAVQMNVPDLLHAAPEAASPADPEGCIGGSIEHVQHEGEPRAEHAAHLEAARFSAADAPRAQSLRGLNVSDLRRAVVMSEILDRPKALRR